MNTTATRPGFHPGATTHSHVAAQGFCVVCGSVWPCWRGRRIAGQDSAGAATGLL